MQVTVLFFATLKDLAGFASVILEFRRDEISVADLREELSSRFPQITPNLRVAIAAVNEEFAFPEDAVKDKDIVAFFPPVSGGDGLYPEIYRLADSPVDMDKLIAAITVPETGAVCLFSGMVRGQTTRGGQASQTKFLEYEAYEPMAIARMKQVASEIRNQWPLVQGIAIVQRVGRLEVGQNTILIACSAGHRDEGCFEAARFGIDRLKEIVPVWKKDIRPDREVWVEGHYIPGPQDRSSK
ncbi:MAG: molybdenum cofactor biosynthesis protein MoaE [Anaerolineae bacterium]|nr:molybdenum cofactor biosynthesis protein MoaE [Anaerolineae bacterium]